jgi:hypothetical protein
VSRQSPASPADRTSRSILSRRRSIRPVAVCALLICGGMAVAPSAPADSVTRLQDAMATARAGTSCQPLSYNPVVEKAAAIINIDHMSTDQPITDPMPGLKDLGYGGNKAALLQGALSNEADAIKGALLQGHDAISDCSYTDLGIDVRRNEATDNVLVVYLLAGA